MKRVARAGIAWSLILVAGLALIGAGISDARAEPSSPPAEETTDFNGSIGTDGAVGVGATKFEKRGAVRAYAVGATNVGKKGPQATRRLIVPAQLYTCNDVMNGGSSGNRGQCAVFAAMPVDPSVPAAVQQQVVTETVVRSAFAQMQLENSPLHMQPDAAKAVVNVPVIVYTDPNPQTFDLVLLDTPVTIQATPVRWTWDFGDGASRTTADPGDPYPNDRVSHTYSTLGQHRITLTTHWVGWFQVEGGAWQRIEGETTTSAASREFEVYGVDVRLVPNPA